MRVAFALYALLVGTTTTTTIAAPAPRVWDFATSTDVIGMNPAYLEQRLGPAKYKYTPYWTFQIGGCEITYNVDRGRVQGYEFKRRPRCESSIRGYGDLKGTVLSLRDGVTQSRTVGTERCSAGSPAFAQEGQKGRGL